jgi:Zn-dependent protease
MGIYNTFLSDPLLGLALLVVYIVSLSAHEFGHAITALWMGDDTPRHEGRITLNPVVHIDPVGLMLLVFGGFGWARAVNVVPERFHSPFWGNLLVSSAGIIINAGVAALAILLLRLGHQNDLAFGEFIKQFLVATASINITLAVFNALPIPPLDGSHILATLVPGRWGQMLRQSIPNSWVLLLVVVVVFNGYLSSAIAVVQRWALAWVTG